MKFLLLGEVAAPFRVPLFNALAERVNFRAVFLTRVDPLRSHYALHEDEFRFSWTILPGRTLRRGGRWVALNRGVLRELRRYGPDMVGVGGWNQPAFWQALAYTRARRIPLVVWVESTAADARSDAKALELAKRTMVHAAAGFFVPGTASREYLHSLGVDDARIVTAPNAVEASIYAATAREPHDECRFVYVGRLDPEKDVGLLLRAFARVPGELVVVGDGSEAARLRADAPPGVRFTGALSREEAARELAAADVFVLPSRSEPWGMVLNEAATAGLALVATSGAGAARDLVRHGENGFVVPAGDEDRLTDAMRRLADDRSFRAAAGARSRELVAQHTPDAWANAVVELLARVAGAR